MTSSISSSFLLRPQVMAHKSQLPQANHQQGCGLNWLHLIELSLLGVSCFALSCWSGSPLYPVERRRCFPRTAQGTADTYSCIHGQPVYKAISQLLHITVLRCWKALVGLVCAAPCLPQGVWISKLPRAGGSPDVLSAH